MNRDPLTIEQVLKARMIAYPFTVLNICFVTVAGGALVLTRADRARDCAKKPVYVRGTGEATEHVSVTQMKGLPLSEATRMAGERAMKMAGVSHGDFDHLMLYDAFTSGPPIMLESMGFAKPDEGVAFFENGKSTPGGSLPINTNGGGLSYTHSGMYGMFPLIEATRQLRGECGARQVLNVRLSLVNGVGGTLSTAATVVLSTEKRRHAGRSGSGLTGVIPVRHCQRTSISAARKRKLCSRKGLIHATISRYATASGFRFV